MYICTCAHLSWFVCANKTRVTGAGRKKILGCTLNCLPTAVSTETVDYKQLVSEIWNVSELGRSKEKSEKDGGEKIGQSHCISRSAKNKSPSVSSHHHPLSLWLIKARCMHTRPPFNLLLFSPSLSPSLCFSFWVWVSSSGSVPLCSSSSLHGPPSLSSKAGNTQGSWPWREHVSSNH